MDRDLLVNKDLLHELKKIISDGKNQVAQAINVGLTATYWNIGKRINQEILKNKRAGYGKQIIPVLSEQLTEEFGKGFSDKNLRHMMKLNEVFPEIQIVSSLIRQLSWTHFTIIIYLKTELEREFYAEMCRVEKWSVRRLRKKIDSMLFERTAISIKPEGFNCYTLQSYDA